MPDLPTRPHVKIPKPVIAIRTMQPCYEVFGISRKNRVENIDILPCAGCVVFDLLLTL